MDTSSGTDRTYPRTELVWPGKCTQVERIALPFQVVETVNQSRATREQTPMFADPFLSGSPVDGGTVRRGWTNKLIWGENKYVLASLLQGDPSIGLEPLAGKIDLIYIDPPFATGQDFSYRARVGDPSTGSGQVEEWVKEASIIEETAYRDTWGRGLDSYLQMMYDRLVLMRELLAEDGSLYVHLDWHVGHYLKVCLDEILGYENFVNEIAINRGRRKNLQKQFERISSLGTEHDVILLYRRSPAASYPPVKSLVRASEAQWQAFWRGNVQRPTMQYELLGFRPTRGQFLWSKERAFRAVENYERFMAGGESDLVAYWEKTGKQLEFVRKSEGRAYPEYWIPPKEEGIIGDSWFDIQAYSYGHDFDTEKHEDLLERVIRMGAGESGLVADFFCGSGTTMAVAEKLGRRWIGCDLSRYAIQVSRKRMLDIPDCKPFEVLNLGKYERRHWQVNVLNGYQEPPFHPPDIGGNKGGSEAVGDYLRFIVQLYHAEPVGGYVHLHGQKAGRWVHVGAADAPVTRSEIMDAIRECQANRYTGLDVLGWEWEMGLHDTVRDEARRLGIDLRLLTIPREVMDRRAVQAGDVHFYELAYLKTALHQDGKTITVRLEDFIIPNPDLVPDEVRSKVKKWSDYIDFWAVDWNYQGDTFHNEWQTYRTRKSPTLRLVSDPHTYTEPNDPSVNSPRKRGEEQGEGFGEYRILVKVIDIFGNDTTQLLEVNTP